MSTPPTPPPYGPPYGPPPAWQPTYAGPPAGLGPLGRTRPTGLSVLLYLVTCAIYGLFWFFFTHDEMKRHTGDGIGGLVALLIAFFVSPVMCFLTPWEVGNLYVRSGRRAPVSALTGLWVLLPLVGGIIWFVKTNDALNEYWRSLGAA